MNGIELIEALHSGKQMYGTMVTTPVRITSCARIIFFSLLMLVVLCCLLTGLGISYYGIPVRWLQLCVVKNIDPEFFP